MVPTLVGLCPGVDAVWSLTSGSATSQGRRQARGVLSCQSTDLVKFADLGSPFDPAGGPNAAAEINFLGDIFRRYVRLKVTLDSAADNTGTIFAVGWASRTQA